MKTTQHAFLSGIVVICGMLLFVPAKAFAGLILDAEFRFTYEDNVVGLLSDQHQGSGTSTGSMSTGKIMAAGMGMGGNPNKNRYTGSSSSSTASPGDFYTTISAEAGGFTDIGDSVSVFAKGFANRSDYNTYTDLNATIGGVNAGAVVSLGHGVTAMGSVLGKVKEFGDSERNSTAYGGTLSLKEKLSKNFWLREFSEYELNSASSNSFTYSGTKIGVSAGYNFTRSTFASIGYSYLVQKYDEPAGTVWRTNTVFLSAEQEFGKSWSIGGEYDLQTSRDNMTNASTTDNILSLALRYSY